MLDKLIKLYYYLKEYTAGIWKLLVKTNEWECDHTDHNHSCFVAFDVGQLNYDFLKTMNNLFGVWNSKRIIKKLEAFPLRQNEKEYFVWNLVSIAEYFVQNFNFAPLSIKLIRN